MRIAGIVAEYNPFHNGHLHHLLETRRLSGAERVIAVMDGAFTQRGEPAAFSKWTRARMALSAGVDAVFELPALYAVRRADVFAAGGVALLAGLGVDAISFGSELPLAEVQAIADLRLHEPEPVSRNIQASLKTGAGYPQAWGAAVSAHLNLPREALSAPNAILAVEYACAARKCAPETALLAIPRLGDYHDRTLGAISSASAVRTALERGDSRVREAVPEAVRPLLQTFSPSHGLDDVLTYRLRGMSAEEFDALADASEGLERVLYRLSKTESRREDLLHGMTSRRYTRARASRLIAQALLEMTRELYAAHPVPEYAHLLGVRREALPLLRELKSRATLPIVSDPQRLKGDPVFELECRASDIWALSRDDIQERRSGRDFTEKFIVL